MGLESALVGELERLGARKIKARKGGVVCQGDLVFGYRACLWLRSAVRVQEVLAEFEAKDEQSFYDSIRQLPWEQWMRSDQTMAVDASVRDSAVTHSGFAALKAKDAICDRMRDATGSRPDVDRKTPMLPVHLRWVKNQVTIARDLAGQSLHKRGWRQVQVKSPLNEALAAGLLLLAGYDGTGILLDPMCGSGTFLVEAAFIASDRAPGLDRRFAFTSWPDFEKTAWRELVGEALDRVKSDVDAQFVGIDRHEGSLSIAARSIQEAEMGHLIRLGKGDVGEWRPRTIPDWIFTNPPWGERLTEGVDESWEALGGLLHACAGARAHVLCGAPELTRHLGLKSDQKWPVRAGPVEAMMLRYPVHAEHESAS